jgi:hypothetical protein
MPVHRNVQEHARFGIILLHHATVTAEARDPARVQKLRSFFGTQLSAAVVETTISKQLWEDPEKALVQRNCLICSS